MRIPEDLRHFPTNLVYLAGIFYGLALSMGTTLVPLYLIDLKYGAAQVGIVVSAQGLLQVLLQFAGGVFSDRFGERVVLGFSFAAYAVGVVAMMLSPAYAIIIFGQILIGASRSVYWVAGQSYASRSFPAKTGTVLGRLLAFESGGIAVGGVIAGVQAAWMGFNVAFATCALICVLGMVIVLVLPELPRHGSVRTLRASLAPVPGMLRSRPILFAGVIAIAASLSAALLSSLYSVYYAEVGFGEAFIGGMRSLNAVGTVVVAFSFGTVIAMFSTRALATTGLVLTGLLTLGTAVAAGAPVPAALVVLAVGGTFGLLRAFYPAIAARHSAPEQRGVALSAAAFYWGVGQLVVPVAFGFLAEWTSSGTALWVAGIILMLIGGCVPWMVKAWLPAGPAQAGARKSGD